MTIGDLQNVRDETYLEWLYPTGMIVNRDEIVQQVKSAELYKRRLDYEAFCFAWNAVCDIAQDKHAILLLKYGSHKSDCAGLSDTYDDYYNIPCTCGFEDALNLKGE